MDTTFIKMADCPEMQGQWEPSGWDWVYCKTADADDPNPVMLSDYQTDGGFYGHEAPHCGEPQCSSPVSNGAYRKGKYNPNPSRNFKGEHVWLPTQSQLQEMVKDCDYWIELSHYEITGLRALERSQGVEGEREEYECSFSRPNRSSFSSMEQLWLAFVMGELHSKTWDGKEWVNE